MIWIAPSEKDTDTAALEKCHRDAAEPAVPAPHVAKEESQSARPEGLLGLIFLRFAEVRVIAQRAKLKAESKVPGQIYHP
jgi:type I restriction enzyme M protein